MVDIELDANSQFNDSLDKIDEESDGADSLKNASFEDEKNLKEEKKEENAQ